MLTKEESERYSRQILLDSFGESGQIKLKKASVLVVGAGGLGCPALEYLAAAGVGHLGIVEHDLVESSNLPRQLLYTTSDVGMKKVKAAATRLKEINPGIKISAYDTLLLAENALELIRPFDLVIDGTDNFTARYLINDACALLNKPWVYGSVYKFEGQISLFNAPLNESHRGPDYRSLFPLPPPPDSVPSCHESGVLGIIPGTIGILQATEAIKWLCSIGDSLSGKLLTFDALSMSFHVFEISRHKDTTGPKTEAEFVQMDYELYCSGNSKIINELEPQELVKLLKKESIWLVDIRESGEYSVINGLKTINHPYSSMNVETLEEYLHQGIVFICQRGIRSRKLLNSFLEKAPQAKVFSLKNGVEGWNVYQYSRRVIPNITD